MGGRAARWLALAGALAALGAVVKAAQRPSITLKYDVVYGRVGGTDLTLDLALPPGKGPFPLVVAVHGGGWQLGSKTTHRPLITMLAERGYAAATVGYRLAPKSRWLAQIHDAKCAVRFLRSRAAEYRIDPKRVGAIGESAGGHLALLLGLTDPKDGLEGKGCGGSSQPSRVQAVVAFFPPTDLRTWRLRPEAEQGIRRAYGKSSSRVLADFLGTSDRRGRAARQASPITYVSRGDPPVLLFHGTDDPLVPIEQSRALQAALTRAGVPSRLEVVPGEGHGWGGEKLQRSLSTVTAFFDEHLKGIRRTSARPPAEAAAPLGNPVLEPPTLRSLGVYWVIGGDADGDARVEVEYRKAGTTAWRRGMPLFRVEPGAHKPQRFEASVEVPVGARLYAGSLLLLSPATRYQMRLRLVDPDGGSAERILQAATLGEPKAPAPLRRLHVVPGTGGGAGTAANPFRGLAAAASQARPGDLFLLHRGTYPATFTVDRSGEPGRPIIWRAAGNGEVVIGGQEGRSSPPERAISATGIHDVWFEGLTVRRAVWGLVAHDSARLVVRRCRFREVRNGFVCGRNTANQVHGFFISDNVLEGPSTWPRTQGIEDARGIQVTGTGHVVCYNRVRGFADAIDTLPSGRCSAIDFHNNEISEMTDDGIEMDYSHRNTRCFHNRLTNVFQGISLQPVHGGPVYVFRNALYNVEVETFKLHNSPSGGLMLHNTSVKQGMPLVLWTGEPVRSCVSRNNLFVGTRGGFAFETTAPMVDCDFDADGFAGGPWDQFLKWNNVRYATAADVRARAPVYRRVVTLGPSSPFASGLTAPADVKRRYPLESNDLRLRPGTAAVDAGVLLPGLNDGYKGRAPDLGAYEQGTPLPHYGPRGE